MIFHVLTLFPQMILDALSHSITGRALASGLISVHCVNIRDFAVNKHGQVDDAPYGGGAGMVLMAPSVYGAFKSIALSHPAAKVIYLSPQGRLLNQKTAEQFSKEKEIVLLCGHYEGLDERVIQEIVSDEISIGDYVLSGGEPAAIVFIDAVSRLVPGVLGKEVSCLDESFSGGPFLEYPHYTRPSVFRGREVPEVLLSGNHEKIRKWRLEQSMERTKIKRPDLLSK